ncbi:MAG TPA: 30S ribosomal protein S4 [Clostridia bacterium]|jgi:small subunit ribosomal protein S4|nr:30S ribosomal protein S4 [Clostridia bacterium]
MAKYTGPDCRLCRREGCKLFLKGDRCFSEKCAMVKRPVAPGMHGAMRKKPTPYSVQLREKQKAKRIYGLTEKQFHGYYEMAETMRGATGENMLCLLERRLDNVVYRMGIGISRAQSRQVVNHGHITVNGKTVNIPSYLVKAGDVVAIKETKQNKAFFADLKAAKINNRFKWLEFKPEELKGTVLALPSRDDIDMNIAEHMIVELYSK